ncbi:hypothetical protein [Salinarimonas ramus]|uniref:hypothetical protein n=1 Tax=Salinarimonas ramus TaxID=690164 RepID=UPI00166BB5AD|nr:hypothetical protein [Salinarimonas ramus]
MSEVASVSSGVAPENVREDPVRFVQIRDLTAQIRQLTIGDRPLVARALPIRAGDILIAARGDRTLAAEADETLFGAYATLDLYLIRPDPARLDSSFLLAVLLLPKTGAKLRASTAGASLPRIARDELARLELPDIPLARQRSIGELARAHRSYRELLLRLADRHAAAADLQINEALRASNERSS